MSARRYVWDDGALSVRRGGPPGRRRRAPRGTVLVVDDDPDIRRAVSMLLERECEVLTLEDGSGLLETVEAYRPGLVILDVTMPGEDGFRLCRRLRTRPPLRGVPVLFLTGVPEDSGFSRALAVDGDGYLSKPFDPAELRETVRRLMLPPVSPT